MVYLRNLKLIIITIHFVQLQSVELVAEICTALKHSLYHDFVAKVHQKNSQLLQVAQRALSD
jgi:hypothetical protein